MSKTIMTVDDSASIRQMISFTLISVCMYDPKNNIVGMNHFLLSGRYNGKKSLPIYLTEAGRYGVNAMELIINGMLNMGAEKKNLCAKVFGGAYFLPKNPNNKFSTVGEVNSRFVMDFLRNENIKIIASNLGGQEGRVIHFHSEDFSVYQRKIKRTVLPEVISKERQFWEKEAKKTYHEPELWIYDNKRLR